MANAGNISNPYSGLVSGMLGGNTTTTTVPAQPQQWGGLNTYPQAVTYPMTPPQPQNYQFYVPVIDEATQVEHINVRDKAGKVHSFSPDEFFTKLGLKW